MMIRIVTILGVMLVLAGCASSVELSNRGNAALRAGSPQGALQSYTNAQALAPDAPVPYYNAALAYRAAGDLDRAVSALDQAIQTADERLIREAYYNLGYVYFELGRFRDSAAAFRQVLERDPDDAQARYNYELALFNDVEPTPENQEQQTEPEEQQTDPETTPTNQPNALDGPTPTPERQDNPPDLTATPQGGSGDFADNAESTPVPQQRGRMTIEEAMRLLDALTEDQQALSEYLRRIQASGEAGMNDW